jgi:carbamoyl-phosphate synthase small subunit
MTGLLLEDGEFFPGELLPAPEGGADGAALGEAVFATAMTGYQELVTDPSYSGQILCFTAPMVGNYGVAPERSESAAPQVRAVVMREARGPEWTDWLAEHGVVGLTGVDTRALVLYLRDHGAMRAGINATLEEIEALPRMAGQALAGEVSTTEPYVAHEHGDVRVAVVDYGCKRSIVRRLAAAGATVTVYPHDVDADELAGHDGVLLSNGPGDPEPLRDEIATVTDILGRVPLLGICLGHQLVALATGHETYKLPFGHRGANHPVLEKRTGRVLVTSQNHGFAVRETDERTATHVSLYDGTVEGFDYPELRTRSLQFHPEAGPGPHDAYPLIQSWVEELRAAA